MTKTGEEYNPIFILLAADSYHLYTIAQSYLMAAESLDKSEDTVLRLNPLHLLCTNALELFLKLKIICDVCVAHQDETLSYETIREIVMSELKEPGHNLNKIFNKAKINDEFNIEKISDEKANEFVNQYSIHFRDGKIIYFKDSEAVRYGAFASKKDVSIHFYGNGDVIDFLNKVKDFVWNKRQKTINLFKQLKQDEIPI